VAGGGADFRGGVFVFAAAGNEMSSKRSLFCKKAPQKTFAPEPVRVPTPGTPGQKFFGSFLQKRTACCS
jgi:hypothetical protein